MTESLRLDSPALFLIRAYRFHRHDILILTLSDNYDVRYDFGNNLLLGGLKMSRTGLIYCS